MPRMDAASAIAAIRFGLGPRPDHPAPAEPRAWLLAQLDADDTPVPPAGWDAPPTAADGLAAARADRAEPPPAAGAPPAPDRRATLFRAEQAAWMAGRIATPLPFRERLVAFWLNHLTVSRREGAVAPLAGAYAREAIRPHVTGRYEAMLAAAVRHPAMLLYLGQASSVGPDSRAGRRTGRSLNENLARELLELHTLSPAGGYAQADVAALAALLTGLGVEAARDPLGTVFRPDSHQPGPHRLLGRAFPDGEAGIDAALHFLAGHPATHRHLATKLARHFVADDPPPDAVAALESALRNTGGDLGAASRALVDLPGAWDPPLGKLRDPADHVTAALRALGAGPAHGTMAVGLCATLGQPAFAAPAPAGWPDRAAAWAHPEGALRRIDAAHGIAGRFSRVPAPDVLALALGPLARPETRDAVGGAGSNRDALTLLLGGPEFARR